MKSIQCLMAMVVMTILFMFQPAATQAQNCIVTNDFCGNAVLMTQQCGSTQPNIDFGDINFGCVSTAITAARNCRQSGGPFLGCIAEGFGSYLDCNGGLRIRRRQARRASRQLRWSAKAQNSVRNLSYCG